MDAGLGALPPAGSRGRAPGLLFYGNCQAGCMQEAFGRIAAVTDRFELLLIRSFVDAPWRQLRDIKVDRTMVMLEQIEQTHPTPDWLLEALPPGIPRLRFAPLDTNLLWPFRAVDPRNKPEPDRLFGRYPYGDRLVNEILARGLTGDAAEAAYWAESPARLPDLHRLAALEANRFAARDAQAHVPTADLVLDQLHRPHLFWTTTHPGGWLLRQLATRLLDTLRPLLRLTVSPAEVERALTGFDPLYGVQLPIHPLVAERLRLPWYWPNHVFHMDGKDVTFAQYLRRLIDWAP